MDMQTRLVFSCSCEFSSFTEGKKGKTTQPVALCEHALLENKHSWLAHYEQKHHKTKSLGVIPFRVKNLILKSI